MKNPWLNLPKQQPHILLEDLEALEKFHITSEKLGLRLEVLPVPYLGNLNEASIVLLCLNPGYDDKEEIIYYQDKFYIDENWQSLTFNSKTPFFCLGEEFRYTGGYQWWNPILGELKRQFGLEQLSRKLMCIQYIAYHSVIFRKPPIILPSQEFSFHLVKEAIKMKKVIIVMRSKKLWIKAVPELENYSYIELKNYRRPFISKRNMKEGDFERVISALQE